MMFKKLNIWVTLLAVAFFACEPMEEIYDEMDADAIDGVVTDLSITLSEDDYELALPYATDASDSASLSADYSLTDEQAREFIPYILTDKFPQLGSGSSVTVTYTGSADEVSTYADADVYEFDADDYTAVSAEAGENGFLNSNSEVSSILASNIQEAVEGDVVRVDYEYADVQYEDIEGVTVYDDVFDSFDDYTVVSISGDQEWYLSSYNGVSYAKMSGYSSGAYENEDWIVSGAIDLTGYSDVELEFYNAFGYTGSQELDEDIAVKVSTDFDGDVSTATWTTLTVSNWPEMLSSGYSDFAYSTADLSDFADKTIYVAFYYTSTAREALTWEVSTLTINAGEVIDTETESEFYTYESGDWSKVDDDVAYYLRASDYDAMGAPGDYDNFSSSVSANDYIPEFLALEYPYAQEEDEVIVIYKYYSSSLKSTYATGNLYYVEDGSWTVTEVSLLFSLSGTTWEPDNTIKVTFGASDYTWISTESDYVSSNSSGASNMASYGNFSCYSWSDDQIFGSITARLENLYGTPDDGQKYQVSYSLYCGATTTATLSVIYENGAWAEQ